MADDLIPAHISGRKLTVLHDPKETISQEFISIGGYIRVSTPKEAQASSIEYQKDILKQWAEVEKYNLVKVYTDIKSGEYKYLRNELNEMLNDVKNGKIYGVKFSRKKGNSEAKYYYYRYRCFGRNGKCNSPIKTWHMDKVDKMLIDLVKKLYSNKERLIKSLNKQLNFCEDKNREVFAKREQITNRIKKIDRAMKKQQMAFEEDVITLWEYKDRISELRNEKQQLSNTLMELDNDLTKVDTVVEKFNRVFNNLSQKINSFEEMPSQEQVYFMESIFKAIHLTVDYKITDVVFKI